MKKYFLIQCKRIFRYLPVITLIALVLLGSIGGIFNQMTRRETQKEENQRVRLGVVGDTDDPFIQMGITALSYYDNTAFSMSLQEMTLEEARQRLALGTLSAYIVIPENFLDEAMAGNILPLEFVSAVGTSGMGTLLQSEITQTVSRILLDAQKGVYGMEAAVRAKDLQVGSHMDQMALRYTEYVFLRDRAFSLQQLGVRDGLGFTDSLLCGFFVVFFLLCCLPFGPLMIRRDIALSQMLTARGRPAFLQTLCDFGAYLLALMTLTLTVALLLSLLPLELPVLPLFVRMIPVTVLIGALSFLLYSLSRDLVGGLLLHFFVSLALCAVSGCLFPVYFFPSTVQLFAGWLPTGVAHSQLACGFTGSLGLTSLLALAGYSLLFFLLGSFLRCRRIREVAL